MADTNQKVDQFFERHASALLARDAKPIAGMSWSYRGQPRERYCYQLVQGTEGYQIAALTPMA